MFWISEVAGFKAIPLPAVGVFQSGAGQLGWQFLVAIPTPAKPEGHHLAQRGSLGLAPAHGLGFQG